MTWFTRAEPERTYALVVGIEKYEGQDANLDGPATDAAAFTQWLLDRGVPAPHIYVAVAPLDKNAGLLGAWEAEGEAAPHISAATQEEIYDIVWNRMRNVAGDLLIVHWGGHGVVTSDKEDTRRLFFSNFPFHLDCDSLLRLLRRSDWLGDAFPDQQICFFDACSKEVDPSLLVNAFQFPTAGPNMGRKQFSLFSTAPGELARNVNELQTGLFTQVLLKELADKWPPAVSELSERLSARFVDLKRTGKAGQTPNSLWFRDPTGTRWSTSPTARGSPLRALEPIVFENRAQELAELRQALGEPDTKIAWIQGLAGVGKSTLARGALDDIAGTSTSVWISCRGLTIDRLISEVAVGIGADQFDAEHTDSVERASATMLAQTVEPAYLVLDNFEDILAPDDTYTDPGIGEFIESLARYEHPVRAIVTTRRLPSGLVDDPQNYILLLRGLAPDKAAALFHSLTELDAATTQTIVSHQAFERLEGHPQLIRMMPGYFTLLPFDQALAELGEAPNIQQFVTSAVLDGVDDEGHLLMVAAVVFRDTFPYAALRATFEAVGGDSDRVAQLVGSLNRRGLIEVAAGPGTYFVHPVIRDCLPRAGDIEATANAAAADYYLDGPIVGDDPDTWDQGLFHLRRAAQLGSEAQYAYRFERFLYEHSRAIQFGGFGRRVVLESRHLETLSKDINKLIARFQLAGSLWKQGDLNEAEALYLDLDQAFDQLLVEAVGEEQSEAWQVAAFCSVLVGAKLGDVGLKAGDVNGACEFADKIDRLELDPPDPLVDYRRAELRFSIARHEQDGKAALRWAERALAIAEQAVEAEGQDAPAAWIDRVAEGHFMVGLAKLLQNDVEGAISDLGQQLSFKAKIGNVPGMAAALISFARILLSADPSGGFDLGPALIMTAAQIQSEAGVADQKGVTKEAEKYAPVIATNPSAIAEAENALRGWSPKLVPYYHRALETYLGIPAPAAAEGDHDLE